MNKLYTWGRIPWGCTQVLQADKSVWNFLFTQGHKRLNELTQFWLNKLLEQLNVPILLLREEIEMLVIISY